MSTRNWLCTYTGMFAMLVSGAVKTSAATLLDHSFDTDGRVYTTAGDHTVTVGRALAFQADGKIVVAGSFTVGEARSQFGAARYHPDGSLDTSFGTGGIVITPTFSPYPAAPVDVAVQPDGKILVVGKGMSAVLVRYLADGTLDSSFGGGGKVMNPYVNYPETIALQADGKILIGGSRFAGNGGSMVVQRYSATGSVDTSFNGTGRFELKLRESSVANDLVVQPDGNIVIAGYSWNHTTNEQDATLLRLLPNGALDNTFGDAGIVDTPLGGQNSFANSVALQSDGKIVIGGEGAVPGGDSETGELFQFMAARYLSDGTVDTTFNGTGFALADLGVNYVEVASVMMQGDKVVLFGTRHDPAATGNNHSDFALARFASDGSLDTTFNLGGLALTDFNRGQDHGFEGAVQADGKIVATGLSAWAVGSLATNLVIARYNLDGASSAREDDGGGIGLKGPPKIRHDPLSQIVPLGGVLNLYCSHSGAAPFTYQWFKNGKPIAGATNRSYSISMNVSVADIGKYTVRISNASGTRTSKAAFVGVIDTEPREVNIEATRKASLNARATVPAGSPVTYQWHYNNEPLKNGSKVNGVTTPTLKFTNPQFGDEGDYTCVVAMDKGTDGLQWNQSTNWVTIVEPAPKPVMDPVTLAAAMVNEPIPQTPITATNNPTKFEARGLPPGIVMDPATGVLSGTPTRAKIVAGQPAPYKVTFTAINGGGRSDPLMVDWVILPLPQALAGNYSGVVTSDAAPASAGTTNLNGTFRSSITNQGVATGVLTLGRQAFRFTAPVTVSSGGDSANLTVTISRGRNQSPLNVSVSAGSGSMSGLVTVGAAAAQLNGTRQGGTTAAR